MRDLVKPPILIVDDDEVTLKLLREIFAKEGYPIRLAQSGEEAVAILREQAFPIVVSDIRMLELDGMAVLKEAKKRDASSAVILMTGFGSVEGAIEAVRQGAFDYLSKPFKMDHLKSLVSRAVKQQLASASQKKQGEPSGRLDANSKALIGKTPQIVEVYKTLARAAVSQSCVLITGESGSGKELVARAIHENSIRRGYRFVVFDCLAHQDSRGETELFGNEKSGLIEDAHQGTLFLNEVGDLSPALQLKILRALEEGAFKSPGEAEPKNIDVRIIASSHSDLEAAVKSGKFREDLFYRLKVIQIQLPPLRERMADLQDMVEHFLARYAEKSKKAVSHVSDDAFEILRSYTWPGNIRELEHAIERAVAMTGTSVIFPEDLPPEVLSRSVLRPKTESESGVGSLPTSLEDMEKQHILRVLQEVHYNKSKASDVLGIDRATLYRKALRYGIDLRGK